MTRFARLTRLASVLALALAITSSGARAAAPRPPDLLTEAEAQARAKRVSGVTLELTLEFLEKASGFHGHGFVGFTLKDSSSDLRIDLSCTRIDKLSVNGTAVETSVHDGNALRLPSKALKEGANRVEIVYFSEYERTGNGLHYFQDPKDGNEYTYTNFEPFTAHRLFPCFDQPDLKVVLTLAVKAPASWEVVSNAPVAKLAVAGEMRRHEFEPTRRISTYLLFAATGPYASLVDAESKIPSRIFARQSMAQYVEKDELFLITRQGLDFFQKYFDEPYPFGKYDQLFVPEFNPGAMENPGAVTFNEKFLFRHEPTTMERQGRAEVILHEMAHMWFGDLVTMRWWDGLWLNESFATYMSYVALTEATKFTEAFDEFLFGEKGWAYWQDQLPTTHPIQANVPDTDTAFSNFDGITYGKGAAMLKQLAFFVEPEKFRDGVRLYFDRHAWGNTEISDFIQAISDASDKKLDQWSRIHLETSGVNALSLETNGKDGVLESLTLVQDEGNGDRKLRPQRLQVALYTHGKDGKAELRKVIPETIEAARTPVEEAKGAELPIFIWPNHGDHAYLRVFLDPLSLAYAQGNLNALQDGLTRRGVWMTLWEMVRAYALAPAPYLDIFLRHVPAETDPNVVQGLFRGVRTILAHYLKEEQRAGYVEKLHAFSWERLDRAAPGSDEQKAWFSLAVDTAESPKALTKIAGLLDGKIQLVGLEMDPEKRWSIVTQLCAHGHPGSRKRIQDELARDDTDMGRRYALRAEASLPEPEVKAAIWKRIFEDEESSLGLLRSAMGGFKWAHQPDLMEPYVDRYFESILPLREKRGQEFASTFVGRLFPNVVKKESVLEKSRKFLAEHPDLPPELRKDLLNENFELEKALRILAE